MFMCTRPIKATYLTKEQIRRKLNGYMNDFGSFTKDRLKVNDPRLTDAFCRRIAKELGKAYTMDDEEEADHREAEVLWTGVAVLGIDPRNPSQHQTQTYEGTVLPTKWPKRWSGPWDDMLPG